MILTKDRDFYKSLLTLGMPIALASLLSFGVSLSDSLMIGRLGGDTVSGVYLANQVQTLMQIFCAGIDGALLIFSAQYWGRGDKEKIKSAASAALKISLIFAVIITIICIFGSKFVIELLGGDGDALEIGAEYLKIIAPSFVLFALSQALISALRGAEVCKIGTVSSLVTLAINVLLNYLLIFGKLGIPALGARGAAIATLFARGGELAATAVYVLFLDKRLRMKLPELIRVDFGKMRDFLRAGAPVIAAQGVWAVNTLSQSVILSRLGKAALTAVSVASVVNSLAFAVISGASGAVGIIIGKTVGSGELSGLRERCRTAQIIFPLFGFILSLAILGLSAPVISLYNISAGEASVASSLILVLAVGAVFTCYQSVCLVGIIKSGGDTRFVLALDAFLIFLLVIPVSLVALYVGAPPWGVYALLKLDQLVKCPVALVRVNRYRWIKRIE